jgi:hypothetical protein
VTHLTHEQLSALHDGALAPAELAAAEAHLATCETCRAELAGLAALDESLDSALTFDPGEAYFADFASRVSARIAAEAAAASEPPSAPVRAIREAPRRSWWATPRAFGFAGAAAALVVTAGVAWMMFGRTLAPGDLLRSSTPEPIASQEQAAPRSAASDLAEGTPSTDGAGATAPREDEVAKARPELSQESPARAREVKTLANGEAVPVRLTKPVTTQAELRAQEQGPAEKPAAAAPPPGAQGEAAAGQAANPSAPAPSATAAAPVPASPQAQMKQRAAGPAGGEAPKPAEQLRSAWGNLRAMFRDSAPAPTSAPSLAAPPTMSKDAATRRALDSSQEGLSLAAAPIEPACGVVRDSRGAPVRGAQLTLLGARTRTTRSAADGTYCLDHPVVGDTLIVMRVGFEPVRFVLVSSEALALALEPVGTLGSKDGLVLGGGEVRVTEPRGITAPGADVYERETATLRAVVAQAREAAAIAAREHTPEAWDRAAARWRGIAAATSGAPSYDAAFRELSALREALALAPSPERSERFKQAMTAYLAGTPRTLPERSTVQRWQVDLRRSSTYR